MNTQELLNPKRWSERTFGGVRLHDMRRTKRAVQAASKLAENPLGSLPAQMQTWKETKALYRLLDEPDVSFAALMQPHLQQTRDQANSSSVVLLVQDTTDIDLSHRHKISGVGQIGNERGRGFFVQTVLAVRPQTGEVLGCIAQEPFVRIPAPEGEQRYQRRQREERESDVWIRQVQAIGTPQPTSRWVHVGDRGADMFPLYVTIFPDPFNQGSAGFIPARYTLPGKDLVLHTARPIKEARASPGSFPGPIDDWRDVLRAPVI
jgi:Transposase DNA-binding